MHTLASMPIKTTCTVQHADRSAHPAGTLSRPILCSFHAFAAAVTAAAAGGGGDGGGGHIFHLKKTLIVSVIN